MYLAFDTETTGLFDNCNVLTAYFIILDKDLNELDSLDLKIKYNFYTIYTKAMEINKIDLIEHDKIALTKEEAINKLELFLNKNKTHEKFSIMGHNVVFDLKMLKSNGIFTDELIETYILEDCVDTLILARKLKKEKRISQYQSLSLNKICNYYDISLDSNDKFHNAEYDIRMTVELYKKFRCELL